MAEQQGLDLGLPVNHRQFDPVPQAVEGARQYTNGRHTIEGLENVTADRFRGYRTATQYRAAAARPESPTIRRSYRAMANDTDKQYDFMTKPKEAGGMGLHHEVLEHDPYGGIGVTDAESARQMAEDVRRGTIKTMATSATGPHAFFSNEQNDRFRAVHDVFGHAATGRGFDAHGEEAAYLSHRQMYSSRARPAMTSETHGQNSFLNWRAGAGGLTGPEAEFPNQDSKLIQLPASAARRRR
jgi:hypothetical protein